MQPAATSVELSFANLLETPHSTLFPEDIPSAVIENAAGADYRTELTDRGGAPGDSSPVWARKKSLLRDE